MNEHTKSLADMYAFNSTMIRVGLTDMKNEDATYRGRSSKGSSISFLVGHLLSSRVGLLKRFGVDIENPYAELFGGSASAADGSDYPDISELAADWARLSEQFEAVLADLTDDQVLAPAEGFPTPDQTARGALMFMAWHESYHAGQIGMIRTERGYTSLQSRLYEEMPAA